jgi:hypothetical protein
LCFPSKRRYSAYFLIGWLKICLLWSGIPPILHAPHIPRDFLLFQFFRKKTFHLSSQRWKLVIRLPAVSEVGGKILFRLHIINSVWTLVSAGPPCIKECVRSVATRTLVGFYIILWLGLYCPFCVNEFET